MKKLLLFSIAFTCACVNLPTATGNSNSTKSSQSQSELQVQKAPAPAQTKVTGKNVFVEERYATKSLSTVAAKNIIDSIKAMLTEKGYTIVDKRRLGHLTVYVQSTHTEAIPEVARKVLKAAGLSPSSNVKVTQTHKRIENGKVVLNQTQNLTAQVASLNVIVYMYDYGQRPERLSWLTITSPEKEWTGFEADLEKEVKKQLKFLFLTAPNKNKKMKGDPGCIPRFGYEHENGKVIKVLKGSPAQTAGFKVGDTLLSIDSESPMGETSEKVYEAGTLVPVKLQRGEKIIRTSIKSKIMCDD